MTPTPQLESTHTYPQVNHTYTRPIPSNAASTHEDIHQVLGSSNPHAHWNAIPNNANYVQQNPQVALTVSKLRLPFVISTVVKLLSFLYVLLWQCFAIPQKKASPNLRIQGGYLKHEPPRLLMLRRQLRELFKLTQQCVRAEEPINRLW